MAVLLGATSLTAGLRTQTSPYSLPSLQKYVFFHLHSGTDFASCQVIDTDCWLIMFLNTTVFQSLGITVDKLTLDGVSWGGYKAGYVGGQHYPAAVVNFSGWHVTSVANYITLDYAMTNSAYTTVVTNVTAADFISLTIDGNSATQRVSRTGFVAGASVWQLNYTWGSLLATHHFIWTVSQIQPPGTINGIPVGQFINDAMLIVGFVVFIGLGFIGAWWLRGRKRGGV